MEVLSAIQINYSLTDFTVDLSGNGGGENL